MRMFIYGGDKESEYMTSHIHEFKKALGHGHFHEEMNKFKVVINPEGEHNESYWSKVFPQAIKWLYFKA